MWRWLDGLKTRRAYAKYQAEERVIVINGPFEIALDEPEEKYEYPSYSDPGSLLVKVLTILNGTGYCGRYELEVIEFDCDSSLMWLNEGIGIDYWLQDAVDFDKPGYYVIEGVTGTYYRGDGYTTDDDEEWDYEVVRPATLREALFKRLFDGNKV